MALVYRCLKKQLKDFEEFPVEGVSFVNTDEDNFFYFHGNIRIDDGIYKGVVIHFHLTIPNDYPFSPPSMYLPADYPFNASFHEHIHHQDKKLGICANLTSNFESYFKHTDKKTKAPKGGWNPSYGLKELFFQLKYFFADPDLPEFLIPNSKQIALMKDKISEYKCKCGHTGKKPYPSLLKKKSIAEAKDNSFKNKYICSILKEVYSPTNGNVFGYPVNTFKTKYGRRIFEVEPTLLSWKACEFKKNVIENKKSCLGHTFNLWIPCYLEASHFKNAIPLFLMQLEKFKIDKPFDVYLNVMTNIMIKIFKKEVHNSQTALNCYVHLLHSVHHYIKFNPKTLELINKDVYSFITKRISRNKRSVSNIGNFTVQMFLSSYDLLKKDNFIPFFEEYCARQVFWQKKEKLNFEQKNDKVRIKESFKASEVSFKLLAFNVMMYNMFINEKSFNTLDKEHGNLSNNTIETFQKKINELDKITTFEHFFEFINIKPFNTSIELFNFLNETVDISNEQGYTKAISRAMNL